MIQTKQLGRRPLHMAAFAVAALVAVAIPASHSAPSRAQPQPRPTAGPPNVSGAIVGQLPSCDLTSRLATEPVEIAVGAPLTLTVEIDVRCPSTFDRAAVLFVLGGVDDVAASSVGKAVGVLLDAIEGKPEGRLGFVVAGAKNDVIQWATSAEERHAAATAIRAFKGRPSPPLSEWSKMLDDAAAALSAAPFGYRPILVVVQAAESLGHPGLARAALHRAAIVVRDRVGQAIVLDASQRGWLIGDAATAPPDGLIGVVDFSTGATRLADGAGRLVAVLNRPIDEWFVSLSIKGPIDLDLTSASPFTSGTADPRFVEWSRPPTSPHHATAQVSIRARSLAPEIGAAVVARLEAERTGVGRDFGVDKVATVCIYPPEIGPRFCHPPTATPTIRATPERTATRTPFRPPPSATPPIVDAAWHVAYLPVAER